MSRCARAPRFPSLPAPPQPGRRSRRRRSSGQRRPGDEFVESHLVGRAFPLAEVVTSPASSSKRRLRSMGIAPSRQRFNELVARAAVLRPQVAPSRFAFSFHEIYLRRRPLSSRLPSRWVRRFSRGCALHGADPRSIAGRSHRNAHPASLVQHQDAGASQRSRRGAGAVRMHWRCNSTVGVFAKAPSLAGTLRGTIVIAARVERSATLGAVSAALALGVGRR
jgi:hypothetical protein